MAGLLALAACPAPEPLHPDACFPVIIDPKPSLGAVQCETACRHLSDLGCLGPDSLDTCERRCTPVTLPFPGGWDAACTIRATSCEAATHCALVWW